MALGKCENLKVIKVNIEEEEEDYIPIACGHCPHCRRTKWNEWSMRNKHELIANERMACFITMTYRPKDARYVKKYKPINEKDVGTTLLHEDFQAFIKRLRKWVNRKYKRKIRYYMCGEYGPLTARAHYHAIIYGLHYLELTTEKLEELWGLGRCETTQQEINEKIIKYVTGYVKKKLAKPLEEAKYEGRKAPYGSQSQGIGREFFEQNKKEIIKRMKITNEGYDSSVPRYYVKRAFKEEAIRVVKKTTPKGGNYYKVYKNKTAPMTAHILRMQAKNLRELWKLWNTYFKELWQKKYIKPEEYWKEEIKFRITMTPDEYSAEDYQKKYENKLNEWKDTELWQTQGLKFQNQVKKELANKYLIYNNNHIKKIYQENKIKEQWKKDIKKNLGFTPEMFQYLKERGKKYCDIIRGGWYNKREKLDRELQTWEVNYATQTD